VGRSDSTNRGMTIAPSAPIASMSRLKEERRFHPGPAFTTGHGSRPTSVRPMHRQFARGAGRLRREQRRTCTGPPLDEVFSRVDLPHARFLVGASSNVERELLESAPDDVAAHPKAALVWGKGEPGDHAQRCVLRAQSRSLRPGPKKSRAHRPGLAPAIASPSTGQGPRDRAVAMLAAPASARPTR